MFIPTKKRARMRCSHPRPPLCCKMIHCHNGSFSHPRGNPICLLMVFGYALSRLSNRSFISLLGVMLRFLRSSGVKGGGNFVPNSPLKNTKRNSQIYSPLLPTEIWSATFFKKSTPFWKKSTPFFKKSKPNF